MRDRKDVEITNWKLKEIIDFVEIIADDSVKFVYELMQELNLPISEEYTGIIRGETHIDWGKMVEHYKFYFDNAGWENKIQKAFKESELKNTEHLIFTYGWKEPTVMIPTELFLTDWEGFIASTQYETLIFSEDYKLIMEVSRDYFLHSNFKIMGQLNLA